jgi:hypothetical protein
MPQRGPLNESEREIVKTLVETKAINFEAIGSALAKYGPTMAFLLDGDEGFCGTMRNFTRVYRLVTPTTPVENLESLRQIGGDLQD